MGALVVLIGCALGLVALGGVGRVAPGVVPGMRVGVGVLGFGAATVALLGVPVAMWPGVMGPGVLAFGVDGLSGVVLAALLLVCAAEGVGAVVAGALSLAVLAGDGVGLCLGLAVAVGVGRPRGLGPAAAALGGLACVMLALGGGDPRFAAMRALPVEGWRGAVALAGTVGSVALLPAVLPRAVGGLAGVYVLARVLLDLSGPVAPVWWGVPVLVLGAGWGLVGAREAARAGTLDGAAEEAGLAALGVAAMGVGAALLARGADQLPLAALGVAGALVQILAWGVWGALLALCGGVVRERVGGSELARMGGLLRRAPATGLALLAGLGAMSALPLMAGFGGVWTVAQAVLGAGRLGGVALVLAVCGASAGLGVVVALLAAGAVRLAGVVLLGAPRTAKALAVVEPARRVRLAMGALVLLAAGVGVCPGVALLLAQPGARLLAGAGVSGGGVGAAVDGPGYVAGGVAVLFVAGVVAVGWVARAGRGVVPGWQGGFNESGAGREATWPLALRWRVPPMAWDRALLGVLALLLAAAVGWAAR